MPPIGPDSLVVVTGITGYIASHVGLAALQAGHRVRGTVRSLERAQAVRDAFSKHGVDAGEDKFEFVVLDDLMDQSQYERAFKGADGIAHVALPSTESADFVDNAIAANLAVLRAAAKEPTVKRVALTSSSAAVISYPDYVDRPVTDKDWNDAYVKRYETATEEMKRDPSWLRIKYPAGKTLADKASWKFVEEEKPAFDLVTILPNANFGPILLGDARSTAAWIDRLLKNDGSDMTRPGAWFIDVRDDGRLHILGLTSPSLGGKRIWAAAEPFGWNLILSVLRKNFPKVTVPADKEGRLGETSAQKVDNSVAGQALGGWISLEQSIVDTAKAFGY